MKRVLFSLVASSAVWAAAHESAHAQFNLPRGPSINLPQSPRIKPPTLGTSRPGNGGTGRPGSGNVGGAGGGTGRPGGNPSRPNMNVIVVVAGRPAITPILAVPVLGPASVDAIFSPSVIESPSPSVISSGPTVVSGGSSTGTVAGDTEESDAGELQSFAERYLEVANETKEAVTVYVQYRTFKNGAFSWLPADPRTSSDAVWLTLEPGQRKKINDGDSLIRGSKIRICGKSESGTLWTEYRDRDLWLVPETDDQGQHIYQAREMETVTFTIR